MAKLIDIVKKGSTDRSVTLLIIDSTDGTPETGVVYNTSGIDLWYRRELGTKVSITEVTLAALTTAHADGGFLHIADGEYRLDLPDAAVATGANHVDIGGTVTGMVVIGGRIRLVDYDPEDAVALGLSRIDAAITSRLSAAGYTVPPTVVQNRQEMDSNSTKLANLDATTSSRLAAASYSAPPSAASIRAEIDSNSIKLDAAVSTRLSTAGYTVPPTAIAIRQEMDSNSTKLAAAALEASLQGLITTVGALNNLSAAGVRTAVGLASANLDTQLSGINAKTTNLPPDPADESLLEAAITAAQGAITSAISALNNLSAAGVRTAVGLATANLDTQLSGINSKTTALPSDPADESLLEAAIAAVTSTLSALVADKTGYRLSAAGVDDVLDEIIEGAVTLRQSMRLANSANAGKTNGMGTSTANLRDLADTKNRVTATTDVDGNRTSVTRDLT